MAARRVASSAVQWAQIAERVPVKQREAFRALKGRNDAYISKLVYDCLLPFDFTYTRRVFRLYHIFGKDKMEIISF